MRIDLDLCFRLALDSDLESIAQLEQQLFISPWSLAQLQKGLCSGYWIWVATQQDRVAGYLIASHGGGIADLLTLGVDPACQGCGVGQQLLDRLFHRLAVERADALFLEVRGSNAAALALYHKCGFESVATRKGYYRDGAEPEDALVMRNTRFVSQ